jgi:predicted helicase
MTFDQLLAKYRKYSFSERHKGERFERLMQAYLLTDPKYAYRFKKVWLWNEFPGRRDMGGSDIGIDLVAHTQEGEYWAIQCKCFDEGATIGKGEVDSFLATSGKRFKDVDTLQSVGFSHRLWISTTNKWGPNATEAITNQEPAVTRVNLTQLRESSVDWARLEQGLSGEESRAPKKQIRPHQRKALEDTHTYFQTNDRGQLIMACGTGKTFTALRIAEHETAGQGLILFMVPSIALLGQTLKECSADAADPIKPICICSDSQITRSKSKQNDIDCFSVVDLAVPASTNVKSILKQLRSAQSADSKGMTVVFSTYQSIDVVAKAQKELQKESGKDKGIFDLVICDEAHRTTGVTLTEEDSSAFVKVHDNGILQAKKRLYMTATPRLFSDDAKGKAAQADAVLCSMDDPKVFGDEIYRIGFGEAVERDLLSDYKVLILTLSDKDVPPAVQKMISDKESEINTDDASKLIGCINALSKQILGDDGVIKDTDPEPMRRAVAFCQNIKVSQKITNTFNSTTEIYLDALPEERKRHMVSVTAGHIDGTMAAPQRDELLSWLKSEDTEAGECRVLTNVRCLSEGVDVPSLDAVLFLSARNSQVDVVQSVGRVMRKAPGKKYGYIIIPVVVPSDVEADKALDDNERFRVVWTVLNALRAHDDRFNATVNKLELNRNKPKQILVGRPDGWFDDGQFVAGDPEVKYETTSKIQDQLAIQFEQLQNVVFARMVKKVGDRGYWEVWARNVAEIAQRHVERITRLIKEDGTHQIAFAEFMRGLQQNINPSITDKEAVEMLSQHIITKPVFEALFEGYSFVKNNPMSTAMQKMLDLLEAQALEKDTEDLNKFYDSVRKRAEGIDNAEGKQRIIIELYDRFFKTAFPMMVEKLGIVYTPVEVVDFIIHSVDDVLKKEFGRSLSDENIHILDPFTGTGTFITRLLQSGLINKEDLLRKYKHEIHANEIVLLAYYIAAVNIENAFHDVASVKDYESFDGICLTDTFQLGESEAGEKLFSEMFMKNSERVKRQQGQSIRVIVGNPPYSIGQKSENDNAQNQEYPILDARIADTYVALSRSKMNKALYDPYIKAFRWSTDRITEKGGGIICFITNADWLDGEAASGFRRSIEKEFSAIYVVNLRGDARTQGVARKKEAGNIFGAGSRNPNAITLLVKKPKEEAINASIHYYEVEDFLSGDNKLSVVKDLDSISNSAIEWVSIQPDSRGDWINKSRTTDSSFISVASKDDVVNCFFTLNSNGLVTNRDAWCYNYSLNGLNSNLERMLEFYANEINRFKAAGMPKDLDSFINTDEHSISWSRGLKGALKSLRTHDLMPANYRKALYRPFTTTNYYFDRFLTECVYKQPSIFPEGYENRIIVVTGAGANKDFSALMSDRVVDIQTLANAQCLPLHWYEERNRTSLGLFDSSNSSEFIQRDGISDVILGRACHQYGKSVTKEDIFYYVYGFLHSLEYRETFANDLKKMLPRLPLVDEPKDFWKFSKAGRALAELHVNYETVPPHPAVKVEGDASGHFKVEKMRFPKKGQKDTILFNSKITVSNIPAEAYDYVVNGKSAIEWIMERYQITTHKESGIKNDPNDWAEEVGNPRYILDLLLSVINVSTQTMEIVKGLPKVKFD